MHISSARIRTWALVATLAAPTAAAPAQAVTQGSLDAIDEKGEPLGRCPLKHTDVHVSISGHLAYVSVTQKFANPFGRKIEAVYTFPLGADAAVSEMMMVVGDRQILGRVKPRQEARRLYEQARSAGHVAALLDQQRPNVFTQAVANIEPGCGVDVTIGYTQTLKYEEGKYRFVFPMVVAPRFEPSDPPVPTMGKPAPPRIGAPPVPPEGLRAGHDIAIGGYIDAGRAIRTVESRLHAVRFDWRRADHSRARFELVGGRTIPNKDFVLEFSTATDRIADAALTHTDERGGFFLLVLEPPKKVHPKQVRPRELVFVIDTSGSQRGFPLDTSKAIVRRVLAGLRGRDTLNLIAFANLTTPCWDKPVAATPANRRKALEFVEGLAAAGGTRIERGLAAAFAGSPDPVRLRIVAMFTDGLIGHEAVVLDQVRKHAATTRVFVYGTGNSPNRYLLDEMARLGRGEVQYALCEQEAGRVARTFHGRIDAPVLTDIEIDWGSLARMVELDEVYPRRLPDLFSARPVVIKGRFKPGLTDTTATITLSGRTAAGAFSRSVPLTLPARQGANAALAQEWARAKVADLTLRVAVGARPGEPGPTAEKAIVELGVKYRLMTQYTSFVAVERKRVTAGGKAVTVEVPVEMPEGMSYEGVFGRPGARPRAQVRGFAGPRGGVPLPRPRFSGTPKNIPPGTRVRASACRPHGWFVVPKGVVNVARKRPVTASDSEPVIGTLDLITDGGKEAREDAYVELGPGRQWVQIDLAKAHAILAIVVWHEHKDPRVYHDVVIEIADDADFTRNVRTVYNNDHDNSLGLGVGKDWEYFETRAGLLVKLKGLKARYVRLHSNGSTADDLNRYTEVALYARPAGTGAGDPAPQ